MTVTRDGVLLLCRCLLVAESAVRTAIRQQNLTTVEEVTQATGAGGGCSSCYDDIQSILDEIHGRPPRAVPTPAAAGGELRRKILEVLDNPMGPLLRANSVQVHVVDVQGNRALVRILTPSDRTTHDGSILAIKRFLVDALERHCGRRIALLEMNVVDGWNGGR